MICLLLSKNKFDGTDCNWSDKCCDGPCRSGRCVAQIFIFTVTGGDSWGRVTHLCSINSHRTPPGYDWNKINHVARKPVFRLFDQAQALDTLGVFKDWKGVRNHLKPLNIRKTCPCNEHPLTPHFYKGKVGFTGVYIFFLIFALKHRSWVLVRTASLRRF